MNLILPDVSITAGPQWATLLNNAFALVDSHNHSTGQGVQISPSGLNISSDLTFAQNNATNLRTVRLYPNNTFTPGVSDRTCLYALGGELYYIDATGNNVQITINGTIDVAGAISALSIKDSSFFIQYFGDTTRQFRFNASAIPASTTRILSVPDSGANDTFVTQAASQVMTNKTLTSPVIAIINTGTVPFTLPAADGTNGQVIQTDGAGTLSFVAPATTIGNVASNNSNVVFTNSDNRTQVCNPSAARTYTLPTTSILSGDTWNFYNQSEFLITVNASGGSTEGYVYPLSSATFIALQNTPTTNAHWNHYYHTASEWTVYTPTFSAGFGTTSGGTAFYKIIGDTLYVKGSVTCGTVAASLGSISVPAALTISAAKLSVNNLDVGSGNLCGAYSSNSTGNWGNLVTAPATSTSVVYLTTYYTDVASNVDIPKNMSSIMSTGALVVFDFNVPLV